MRIVGETIVLVTREGGGYDRYGDPLPVQIVNVEIPGAVFIPEGTGTIKDSSIDGEYQQASVLLPSFEEVEVDAEVLVRGETFRVERPSVHHRSVFGTGRGGTELFLKRAEA
jgi:hypothetical protein